MTRSGTSDNPPLYDVSFDPTIEDQWFLDAPHDPDGNEIDPRTFTQGKRVVVSEGLVVPIGEPGAPLEFSFGAFDMPVVSARVGEVLEQLAPDDVQRIPVRIEGADGPYEILNVVTAIDCIDRDRTVGTVWTEADHRSDLAGEYRMIIELHLDSSRITSSRIFRVEGWEIALIVTEDVKAALEEIAPTGLQFQAAS